VVYSLEADNTERLLRGQDNIFNKNARREFAKLGTQSHEGIANGFPIITLNSSAMPQSD